MVSLQSTVVAATEQVSADLDGEMAILNLSNGVYYGLNPVGARVWELVQVPGTVAALCEQLLAEFDVERGRCEQEVLALLADLEGAGLIEVRDGQAA
ncbi:MAG: PqqD family peptide modification chaperone [Thermomicrobiales bacterium]